MSNKEKFKQVAELIGYEFNSKYDHGGTLSKGLIKIFVRYDQKGKHEFSSSVDGISKLYVMSTADYNKLTLSIKCSVNKTPEQIAKDIEKRLLPDLNKYAVICLDRIAQNDLYESKVFNNLKAAQKIIGGTFLKGEQRLSFYCDKIESYGKIHASSDSVSIELNSLPLSLMIKVLEVLKNE